MQLPVPLIEFLQKPNIAVLAAIAPSGRPQATPVWFVLEDGHIQINAVLPPCWQP